VPRRIDMQGMSRSEWRDMRFHRLKPRTVEVPRRADLPGEVDFQQLKREAEEARELMKEMKC